MALFCFLLLCRWEGRWRGTENKWECWCIRSKRHRLWRETGWTTGWPFSERLCRWRHVDRIGQEGHRKIRRERLRMAICSEVNETGSVHDDEYCLSDEMCRWFFSPSDWFWQSQRCVCHRGLFTEQIDIFCFTVSASWHAEGSHLCILGTIYFHTLVLVSSWGEFWLDCIWNEVCSWIWFVQRCCTIAEHYWFWFEKRIRENKYMVWAFTTSFILVRERERKNPCLISWGGGVGWGGWFVV